ncbi:MAG: heterodisulfide reductase-related iron-sulfur binding cluster [Pseudomonadota bacterium]
MARQRKPESDRVPGPEAPGDGRVRFSYFPGCSLKTSGHENSASFKAFCQRVGIELAELPDWNCCGSSSAHSIDPVVARLLPQRNLSLVPLGEPLLVACPSCLVRLKSAHNNLKNDPDSQKAYEDFWQVPFDRDLKIRHFFELFSLIRLTGNNDDPSRTLNGLKTAAYYGCMLARPPALRFEPSHFGLMEKILSGFGAETVPWGYGTQCCGTYLSVTKPKVARTVVNRIMDNAVQAGAECLVTACAMCHLNLELRCTLKDPLPIFHFTELISLALGEKEYGGWFRRHLIDPVPLLEKRSLLRDAGHAD